jgi:hypothetical protein
MDGISNSAFVTDLADLEGQSKTKSETIQSNRAGWGKDIEFLFSCIALSVGLGQCDKLIFNENL